MRTVVFSVMAAMLCAAAACNDTNRTAETKTQTALSTTASAPSPERLKELSTILKSYADASQFFNVTAGAMQVLTGAKGTILEFDTKKLENIDGSPVLGTVVVELKELVTPADLVYNCAPTASNGKMLVSGGSYYINATNNGKTMRLKQGNTLNMKVPQVKDKEMGVFYGEEGANGSVDWKESTDKLTTATKETTVTKPEAKKVVEKKLKEPVTAETDKHLESAPYNCFNLEWEGLNYAVITVSNKIMIAVASSKSSINYITTSVFPATTLCIRNLDNYRFRTYMADTVLEKGSVKYTAKPIKKPDALDKKFIEVLGMTDIRVPQNALVTKVVSDIDLKAELDRRKKTAAAKNAAMVKANPGKYVQVNPQPPATFDYWSTANGGNKNELYHYNANDQTSREKAADTTYNKTFNTLLSTLKVSKMGWVNVDRFYRVEQSSDLLVEYPKEQFDGINTILVFKDIFTVINANYSEPENGIAGFKLMPSNKNAILVAYTTKNNKLYAQVTNVNTSNGRLKLDLQLVNNAKFKNMIESNVKLPS